NRLSLDFTYYHKKNEDVIMPLQVSSASGFDEVWENAATITNKGVEVVLGADIIQNSNDGFNFGVDVNFSKNINEVNDIAGEEGVINLTNGGIWNVNTQ